MQKQIAMDLETANQIQYVCLSDSALADISKRVLLVSSKQLAKILGKKDDSTLRASRSNKTGFPSYKDSQGGVYYNLIEVFNILGIKL